MRKRKIISSIIAISCLLGASGGNGFAVVNLDNNNKEGSTTIRKTVEASYTVVIPDIIDVPDSKTETGKLVEIKLREGFSIEKDKKVRVNIKSYDVDGVGACAVKLKHSDDDSVAALYSPFRITNERNGGVLKSMFDKAVTNTNPNSFPPVAEFNFKGKNVSTNSLYVYRAYEVQDDSAKTKKSRVAMYSTPGTYTGKISFELSYATI